MRRLTAFLVALALLAAPVFAPAQPVLLGPGGLINSSGASVSLTNTTTATTLYAYTVPAGMAQGNFAPLHLKLLGRLTTNPSTGGVGNINIGCNFGGSTASVALVNAIALTANQTNSPVTIDVWVSGYSSAQANGIQEYLQARFGAVQAAGTETVYSAAVDGTTGLNTSNQITCIGQWASASATNSLVISNGHLVVGE